MTSTALAPRRRRAVYRSGDRVPVLRAVTGITDLAAAAPITISALPQVVDLLMYQGDDFYLAVAVFDPPGDTPADLTGAVPLSQLRLDPDHEEIMASFDPTVFGNVVYLHLDHAQATGLRGQLVWDCQITQNSRVTTLCAGRVTVTPEVSR